MQLRAPQEVAFLARIAIANAEACTCRAIRCRCRRCARPERRCLPAGTQLRTESLRAREVLPQDLWHRDINHALGLPPAYTQAVDGFIAGLAR